jgi:hypothetical protein
MKAGVSIAPWAVKSSPARALPSRASITKEKPDAIALVSSPGSAWNHLVPQGIVWLNMTSPGST